MSTYISTCGISFACDILAASGLFGLLVPGGPLSLPQLAIDDPIWAGQAPAEKSPPTFFATGRVTPLNYFVHFIIFVMLFTLYRVLKGFFWEGCQN